MNFKALCDLTTSKEGNVCIKKGDSLKVLCFYSETFPNLKIYINFCDCLLNNKDIVKGIQAEFILNFCEKSDNEIIKDPWPPYDLGIQDQSQIYPKTML